MPGLDPNDSIGEVMSPMSERFFEKKSIESWCIVFLSDLIYWSGKYTTSKFFRLELSIHLGIS